MATATAPEIISPPQPPGPLAWLRKNLFSTWYNSLLTILLLVFIYWATSTALRWVFITADWTPVVRHPLLYLVGQYPREQVWRVGLNMAIAAMLFGMSWRVWGGVMRVMAFSYAAGLLLLALWPAEGTALTLEIRLAMGVNILLTGVGFLIGGLKFVRPLTVLMAWSASLVLALVLLRGFPANALLPLVPTQLWGGLMVTLLLAVGGITLSFPFGVLLALGRRSSLPVLRIFSILFIEIVRGVPLISILFLASLLVPLFLPPEMRIDRLLRALIGMTVFSAAYMAENVRGGLAAVPNGQVEAAKAVGLRGYQVTLLIVLPQALRAVIPPMVGQFISLFKDTTLAFGIAVLELLAVGRSILQGNPEYFGRQMEVLLFIAAIFWVLSYLMSYASLRLEAALGVGER
jgi:general L-amino acid transport system permease protein